MMSYSASAVWSRPVSSPCYTEHGPCCSSILSDRITTIAMLRSDQLGLCCSVEPNCSGMSACLTGVSGTRDRALDTYESICVPGAGRPFFIPVVHNLQGAVGYVTAPELSSRESKACAT
jgi:hypothetical protein